MVRRILNLSSLGGSRSLVSVSLIAVLVVSLVIIALFESQLKNNVVGSLHTDLVALSEQVDNQVQHRLSRYLDSLRFLFATPPISGLHRAYNNQGIDPSDGTHYEQWRLRLETIFIAFLQNNLEYEQLRVLGRDGMELIRVDRRGGLVHVIEDINLQNKQDRDYFIASANLQEGEIYTSPISLNREFGKIDYPHRPMFRLATPIFDGQGVRFGLLIVNINVAELLASFETMVPKPFGLVMTDKEGYFLIHPDTTMQFSRDLAPEHTWSSHYQQSKLLKRNFSLVKDNYFDASPYYVYQRAVTISNDALSGRLNSILMAPKQYVDEVAMARRISVYSFMFAMGTLFLFVVFILGRSAKNSQALAKEKAQSAAIIDGSKDAIVGVSNSGVINNWNRAAELLFGYDAAYVKGRAFNELSLMPWLDLPDLVAKAKQENKTLTLETQWQLDDSELREILLSVSPVLGANYQALGVSIIIRDISIEKQAAQKIQRVNAELEKKVAIRTQELEKASYVKSTFISNISHEMRTPLNGIVGTLNLIRKEALTDKQKRYLDMAEISVNSLSALINDVLDLSKIEAGKLDMDISSFNPLNLIESICSSMAVKAQEKGLEFIIDLVDLRCQSIVSDPHRISQIISNLVTNAIKFTEDGYIKVKVSSVLVEQGELQLVCEVSDSGIGIADENKAKLFTAFSQATSSISAQYGGTGLGLSICKELSELLHGQVSFESKLGVGSRFTFSMRLANGDYKMMAPQALLKGSTCTVMISHPQQCACIEGTVARLGGCLLPATPIWDWLNQDGDIPEVLPSVLIVEQRNSLLTDLDALWPTLLETGRTLPRVMAFQKSADFNKSLPHIGLEYLNNPLLFSEFINKFSEPSVKEKGQRVNVETEHTLAALNGDIQRVAGARVLVVDDNEINIEVALGVLAELPLEFVRASNGRDAIVCLRDCESNQLNVDCILMDCQMPIMNGYECTRKIRCGEAGEVFQGTPIIAMTASAMMGERDKCIESGMNDYVTKPIVAERLIEKVLDWLVSVYQVEDNEEQPVSPQTEAIAINVSDEDYVWNRKLALSRLMDNQALFAEVCQMYQNTTPEQLSQLQQAIAESDFETVRQLSHALKGLSSSIGALQLQEQFMSLEMEAKMKNKGKLNLLLGVIEPCYEKLMARLQAELETGDEGRNEAG